MDDKIKFLDLQNNFRISVMVVPYTYNIFNDISLLVCWWNLSQMRFTPICAPKRSYKTQNLPILVSRPRGPVSEVRFQLFRSFEKNKLSNFLKQKSLPTIRDFQPLQVSSLMRVLSVARNTTVIVQSLTSKF